MNKTKAKLAIVAVGVAVLGAAGAGSALASTTSAPHSVSGAQSSTQAPGTEVADAPGGPDVQQGDQNSPDTATNTENEKASSETAGGSDGPGGFADPVGSHNVDNQQQGQN